MPGPDRKEFRFGDRMTDLEALMWRLEEYDPMFRSAMTMAISLDQPPDRQVVLDRLAAVTRNVPRLRDRVAHGPLDMIPPRWERDPTFDVANHLRWVPAPGRGGTDDILRASESLAAEPFPAGRPPWQIAVVEGLDSGWAGVVLQLHHSYTDGLGGVRLALDLFDGERHPEGPPVGAASPGPEPGAPARPLIWDDFAFEFKRAADLVRRAGPWAASALRDAAVGPDDRARTAFELVKAIRDQVDQAARPGSPLLARRSAGTRLAAIDLDLAAVKRAARKAGGTVNDAFLSGLLGGLGLYHAKHGSEAGSVRVAVPVSTRTEATTPEMRNQVEALMFRGPLRLTDPVERTRLVHELVRSARGQPWMPLLEDASALGLRLPGIQPLLVRLARSMDVAASNVMGPPAELFFAGARLESMVPFGPRSGAALNLTLISFCDRIHVGVNMDPAATPDASVLLDCLRSGFDEVIGSG